MKRSIYIYALFFLIFISIVTQTNITAQQVWPFPVPCRVQVGTNPDLLVMTLGDVRTPLADGFFDPVRDEVRLNDGTVFRNYYRDSLRVAYYEPIDKSIFPLPPSGIQ